LLLGFDEFVYLFILLCFDQKKTTPQIEIKKCKKKKKNGGRDQERKKNIKKFIKIHKRSMHSAKSGKKITKEGILNA